MSYIRVPEFTPQELAMMCGQGKRFYRDPEGHRCIYHPGTVEAHPDWRLVLDPDQSPEAP